MEYVWSDEHILVAGDSRVGGFMQQRSSRECGSVWSPGADMRELIGMVDRRLKESTSLLILVAFHCDLTELVRWDVDPKFKILKMGSCRIDRLVGEACAATERWRSQVPHLSVVWTIPYTPDFVRYNQHRLRRSSLRHRLDVFDMHRQSYNFYAATRELLQLTRANSIGSPYDLHDVSFDGSEWMRDVLQQRRQAPKFRTDNTTDGLHPSARASVTFWDKIRRHATCLQTSHRRGHQEALPRNSLEKRRDTPAVAPLPMHSGNTSVGEHSLRPGNTLADQHSLAPPSSSSAPSVPVCQSQEMSAYRTNPQGPSSIFNVNSRGSRRKLKRIVKRVAAASIKRIEEIALDMIRENQVSRLLHSALSLVDGTLDSVMEPVLSISEHVQYVEETLDSD